MSSQFFTSDLHFGHKLMFSKYRNTWSDSLNNMDDVMIHNINAMCSSRDILFILGDVSFRKEEETRKLLRRLRPKLILIRGNHDKKNIPYDLFTEVHTYHEITLALQNPHRQYRAILFHYPIRVWNKAHYGAWHFHGHSHGNCEPQGKMLDVGIDNHPEHRPFSIGEIEKIMETRQFIAQDHHGS